MTAARAEAKKNTAFGYEMRCLFMGFLLPENQSLYNQLVTLDIGENGQYADAAAVNARARAGLATSHA